MFSVLGLLLGIASNPSPRVIISSIGHYDFDLNSSDVTDKEAEYLVGLKKGEQHGILHVKGIVPSNSTAVLVMKGQEQINQLPIFLKAGEDIIDGCSRTIKFLKIWESDTAVFVYRDDFFRFSCSEPSFRVLSEP